VGRSFWLGDEDREAAVVGDEDGEPGREVLPLSASPWAPDAERRREQ